MEYLYDVEDGLIMVKEYNDAAIYETSYDYDALGNLTLVTDSRGNQTQFQYNYLSQLINKIESEGTVHLDSFMGISKIERDFVIHQHIAIWGCGAVRFPRRDLHDHQVI